MRNHPILGLASIAAMALFATAPNGTFAEADNRPISPRRGGRLLSTPENAPNDNGPVVDTTPESKRARRRRLAKGK